MIAAVLGDIGGHAGHLELALAHVEERGIHTVLQTGNIAVGHNEGGKCLRLLQDFGVEPVQGELDRLLVRYARKPGSRTSRLDENTSTRLYQALEALSSSDLERLGALPRQRRFEVDGVQLYLCHGAPGSQSEILSPDTPRARMERHREAAPVDFLVCGGAPVTFDRIIGETAVVCPGPLYSSEHVEIVFLSTETGDDGVSRVRLKT